MIHFNLLQNYLFISVLTLFLARTQSCRCFSDLLDVNTGKGNRHNLFGLQIADGQQKIVQFILFCYEKNPFFSEQLLQLMFSIGGVIHVLYGLVTGWIEKLFGGLNLMRRKGQSEGTWLEDVGVLGSSCFVVIN